MKIEIKGSDTALTWEYLCSFIFYTIGVFIKLKNSCKNLFLSPKVEYFNNKNMAHKKNKVTSLFVTNFREQPAQNATAINSINK